MVNKKDGPYNNTLWPYVGDAPEDLEWQADRREMFNRAGNGWWWGWTADNCPIKEMKPYLVTKNKSRDKADRASTDRDISGYEREKEIRKKKWQYLNIKKGETINCEYCGKPTPRKSHRTKYCGRICGDKGYKSKQQWRKDK